MYKILVADDEKVALLVLERELSDAGYDVYTANDGKAASQLIQDQHFDIVILDVYMPYKNGFELVKEIKKKSTNTIILLVTAYASIENAVDAIKLGAEDYLDKPYDLSQLLQKIAQLLQIRLQKSKDHKIKVTKNSNLIGESPLMKKIQSTLEKVKELTTTVLITGESGTGKGVVARELHSLGKFKELPFIHVDCASLSQNLIESELFGYEKGAFTGANSLKQGKFEIAKNGIIFLDEVGTLPLNLQSKLLTVLQDKQFYRIGGVESISMHARVIAATNENIEKNVETGLFREDLFYRLNVIRIEIPPLRLRKEDIPHLAEKFIEEFSLSMNHDELIIAPYFLECLQKYEWPGNIRELENAIESSVALCDGRTLKETDLPINIAKKAIQASNSQENYFKQSIKNQEIITILESLEKFDGHREKTANYLGITRRSLQYKLKKYNLLSKS
ncbi:hypothetical protein ATZ33_03070 [Enterococcus silesiacus]|uniref:Two-component system response regulator n=1 Tax=Enterococcus silesiacus TaxID=332949 RepID=A0ABN4J3J7_9ENTE|nr:sigma-54 dependent transcriptional regulator [Enterococcus silesiacus]ALS00389.1 hypothetical protein ATZ33_03070 [Enterococcus silesiacus]